MSRVASHLIADMTLVILDMPLSEGKVWWRKLGVALRLISLVTILQLPVTTSCERGKRTQFPKLWADDCQVLAKAFFYFLPHVFPRND